MKSIFTITLLLLVALPIMSPVAQVRPSSAVGFGLMYDGKTSFTTSAMHRLGDSPVEISVQTQLGTNVEIGTEMSALFHVTGNWYLGPVAGAGADWSNEPGDWGEAFATYVIASAGVASSFNFNELLGMHGYYKWTGNPEGHTLYDAGWQGAVEFRLLL